MLHAYAPLPLFTVIRHSLRSNRFPVTETNSAGDVVVSEQLGISMSFEKATALDAESGLRMADGAVSVQAKAEPPTLAGCDNPFVET